MSNLIRTFVISTVSLLLLSGTPAIAETKCKGLEHEVCGKQQHCSWVESYKRKDGVTVKGHCRNMPKKQTINNEDKKQKAVS